MAREATSPPTERSALPSSVRLLGLTPFNQIRYDWSETWLGGFDSEDVSAQIAVFSPSLPDSLTSSRQVAIRIDGAAPEFHLAIRLRVPSRVKFDRGNIDTFPCPFSRR